MLKVSLEQHTAVQINEEEKWHCQSLLIGETLDEKVSIAFALKEVVKE